MSTFIRMLRIPEEAEFAWVFGPSGPRIGFRLQRGEIKDLDLLIEALEGNRDSPSPSWAWGRTPCTTGRIL